VFKNKIMRVCYFGIFDPEYNRNKVIIEGLKENGIEIIDCRSDNKGVGKYFELYKKHNKIKNDYDVMIVGFPGWTMMIWARIISRKKKIIFDCFTSVYDSVVFDRKTVKKGSIKAGYYWLLDWLACILADLILLDTNEHIKYFVKTFGIKKEKFLRIWVGSTMKPGKRSENDSVVVTFYGSDIPLQGVEYVIEATKLIKDNNIQFRIIGSKIKNRFGNYKQENVKFYDNVSYEKLNQLYIESDIILGIFGNTDKAKRVIPNKVYDGLAVGRTIIMADTVAVRELLSDENCLFVRAGDSRGLADKIKILVSNNELRKKLAEKNIKLFNDKLRPGIIVKELVKIILSQTSPCPSPPRGEGTR
jgi:glycosyltransferase involved in cell wall biosynthesis